MPDLTIKYYWHCESDENWCTEVIGSSGNIYTVRWSRSHKNHSVEFDYSCTCMAYTTKPGYCKHIKQVEKQRCGWTQFTDGGELNSGKCPSCGSSVMSRGWGI